MLQINGVRPSLFVEPFAGGASVALQLLHDGVVDSIALGERDELVASFWKVLFSDHQTLISQMRQTPITVEQWEYYRSTELTTDEERAMACLFLNRTSFSGVLSRTAGPIGGRAQASRYRIDCRFPVETLARRIEAIARLRDRVVFVHHGDWQSTLELAIDTRLASENIVYYVDPPFYHKADRLYRYYFSDQDHLALRDRLADLTSPWILSYDPAPEISYMYEQNGHSPTQVELLYSVSAKPDPRRAVELIITNLDRVPDTKRLWSTDTEAKWS